MAVLPQVPVTDFEKAGFTPTMTGFFVRLANVFGLLAQGTGFVLTANRAVISDSSGGLAASDVTSTELGYLDGVTSNVQSQLNARVTKGYGEVSVTGNASALTVTDQDTWYQFTDFDTNGQAENTTPDHTNDHITIGVTGVYLVQVSCSFSGSASITFEGQAFKNNGATGLSNVHFERKLGSAGDVGSAQAAGLCALDENDTLELWVQRTDGGVPSQNFVGRDVTLTVTRVG